MHFRNTLSCLLAAIISASHVLADAILNDHPTSTLNAAAQMVTPNSEALQDYLQNGNNIDKHLELRDATYITTIPSATPAVTTFGMNQQIGGSVAWATIVYTQTFASPPDQWPYPGIGSIGLGNLVKQEKREAEPQAGVPASLPSAQPLVLELHEVGVTQWIQPVTQVTHLVVSTVLPTVSIDNASNATISGTGMALTAVASERTMP